MNGQILKTILEREYLKKKAKNPLFSLRAFAKFLGVGIATLSEAISGKRSPSKKNIEKILLKLDLSPNEIEIVKSEAEGKKVSSKELEKLQLAENQFQIVSDWYHYAILSLAEVKSHKANPSWIAKRLGITVAEVEAALKRMIEMQLIVIEKDKIIPQTESLCTTVDTPSAAIRKRHKQILEIAQAAIDHYDVNERFYFEITMAIDKSKLQTAKDMLRKAARKICKHLESGKQEDIYSISTNIFPLKKH